ncbi:MAG: hypothetical protein NZM25_11540 [Leptospiraceae bacterium]|nr:hypothetical protein [Leptospiraceae bacterium]MDW8307430.1 glycerophosphodiester phosphodiesterase family protein [Leptospiraceae bacterium]
MPRPLKELLPLYQEPLLASHRGYGKMGKIPENTWPAFEESTKLGFLAHELDVRRTKDRVALLFHGPLLEQVSDGTGRMEDKTYEELKRLNFAHYLAYYPRTPPTTLKEYLQKIPENVLTNIEMKRDFGDFSPGLEEAVVEAIYNTNSQKRVFISSFNWYSLFRLRKLAGELARGLLLDRGPFFSIRKILGCLLAKPDLLHPHYSFLTERTIKKLQKQGYALVAWTVNDVEKVRWFFQKGVQIVITDNMELIKEKLL